MQPNNSLPIGFISVEDAIALINSDTRSDAKVDTAFLVNNLPYLRVDWNFNIKKLKHEDGKVVGNGETFVHISSEYERAMLEHAITEHYKAVTGRVINPETIGLRSVTTAVDDEKNPSGRAMINDNPMTSYGDNISTHAAQTITES